MERARARPRRFRGAGAGCAGALLPALLLLAGCDEIDEFRTGPDEVFRGQVIGADRDGGVSFIRSGFPAGTMLELTFDPASASTRLAADGTRSAGTIRTYRCPDGAPQCDGDERVPGHFDGSPLEAIANLSHDALSQYDFPGGGRLRNYLFGTRFAGVPDAGVRTRDAMVFLSLMENGRVELRVIAQSVLGEDGQELEPALFGVFPLERRSP